MRPIPLTVATWDYDRVRALIDGRVGIEGCAVSCTILPPEECFERAWSRQEFDVAELGLCTYLAALSRGDCPYVAVPVFISRSFRHSAIYVRDDRGIERPADLKGKRIGVPFYEMAAAVWVRGFLKDDYGVAPNSIEWRQGGLETPYQRARIPLNLPRTFPLHGIPTGATLSGMLAAGELDGIVSARAPSCFERGDASIRRLFRDYREREVEYFGRTGIFPIMHVVGIRRTLVEAHPSLAGAVYEAFVLAKRLADADLREVVAPKIGLPWIAAEAEATERIMGPDFWPYGVESNAATLQVATRYAHEQGLTLRQVTVEEMFAPTAAARDPAGAC